MKRGFAWLLALTFLLATMPGAASSEEIPVYLDQIPLQLESPPILQDGRALAPMRGFFEALGAEVGWEPDTRTAVGVREGITVRIAIDSTTPTVNGVPVAISVPAQIINGRTYIPLRFVGEALGDEVIWNPSPRSVDIIRREQTVAYKPACLEDAGTILTVPGDHDTIQAAIDAASNGDGVLVGSGTYHENIDFLGKSIVVTSEKGPDDTIINGGFEGSVVVFRSSETREAVLHGFTIMNGMAGFSRRDQAPEQHPDGGGIAISDASPTVSHCIITRNACTDFGGGISIDGASASPLIENNDITDNISHYQGAGISIRNGAQPIIRANTIYENICEAVPGIQVARGAGGLIEDNVIRDNVTGYDHDPHHMYEYLTDDPRYFEWREDWGQHPAFPGGIVATQGSDPIVRNNQFIGNDGGAIGALQGSTVRIEGNIISNNGSENLGAITGGIMVAHDSVAIMSGNTLSGNLGPAIWVDKRNSYIVDQDGAIVQLSGQTEPAMIGDNRIDGIVVAWPLERPQVEMTSQPQKRHVPGDYPTIQAAIDSSQHGDTVVVAPGVYNENIDFGGRHITVRSTDPLDESIVQSTVINGGDPASVDSGQGPIVMFINAEGREAVLEGFTLHNRDRDFFNMSAIYISGASPTIRNNIITSDTGTAIVMNWAYKKLYRPDQPHQNGDRMAAQLGYETAPLLENNVIRDCQGGGGMWYYYASPEIIGNLFTNNTGWLSGSVHNWFSSAIIKDNGFIDNHGSAGGGIHFESFSLVHVENNVFTDNTGGALYIDSPTYGTVTGNAFTGNVARPGSAIALGFGADIDITNNVIADNYGWAVYAGGSYAYMVNNTIANQLSTDSAYNEGLFVMGRAVVEGMNNIFSNAELNEYMGDGVGEIIMSYSLFYDTDHRIWPGEGNILGDPRFVGVGDYRLRAGSPAIDAGTDVNLSVDIIGTPRPQGRGFDMGAYEYVTP